MTRALLCAMLLIGQSAVRFTAGAKGWVLESCSYCDAPTNSCKQIQRLAEDNGWMRRVLMEKVMGFSAEEAARMLARDGQPTTPLLAGKKGKKS